MQIRPAIMADTGSIAHIYNQGIEDQVATLETELRTPQERGEWLAARGPRHPVLVTEDDTGTVVGWGSLNAFNPRHAYDHVADLSVYVERGQRGRGLGKLLLQVLEQQASQLSYHKLVLASFPINTAGMALYKKLGFRAVGIYHEHGMLDGKWIDVIIMEKLLR